jgi:hypothetical protein
MFWKGRSRKATTGLIMVMIVMRIMIKMIRAMNKKMMVMMMYKYN